MYNFLGKVPRSPASFVQHGRLPYPCLPGLVQNVTVFIADSQHLLPLDIFTVAPHLTDTPQQQTPTI